MKRYILALLIVVAIVGGSFTFSTMGSSSPTVHGIEMTPPIDEWEKGTTVTQVKVNTSNVGDEFPHKDIVVDVRPSDDINQSATAFAIAGETAENGIWTHSMNYTLQANGNYTVIVDAENEHGRTIKKFNVNTEKSFFENLTGSFTNIGEGVRSTGGTILRIFLLIGGIVAVYLSM